MQLVMSILIIFNYSDACNAPRIYNPYLYWHA